MTDREGTHPPEPATAQGSRINSHGLRMASLLYLWLLAGFTLGTAILLWPVRWLTATVQRAGGSQTLESALVIALVLAYVAASFFVALRLNRYVCAYRQRRNRLVVVGAATLIAMTTAWTWRNPGRMLSGLAGGGDVATMRVGNGAIFEFGAYPDIEKLKELKAHGVTAVITLQDPRIPVEREGVDEERRAAASIGIDLISAPMIPWFSENHESLQKIRAIASSGNGHYYVHCGLGRDRVNMAKRVIESVGGKTAATPGLREALGFEGRQADFQQGSLVLLAPGVWLVPYPEKEELYGCFFEGRPGHVVFLLDSTDARQDSLLKESRRLFSAYGVPFTEIRVPASSPRAAQDAVRAVRAMQAPVTVVAYRTPWKDGQPRKDAEAAVAFRDAYGPSGSWKIMTGTVAEDHAPNEWTGGKEKGC